MSFAPRSNATGLPAQTVAAQLGALAAQARDQLTAPGAPFELVAVPSPSGPDAPAEAAMAAPQWAYRHAFPNLPALLNAGRAHAAKPFIAYEDERWDFQRFFAAVDAVAGRLQATYGVQAGQRVAIAMRNRPEWAVAFAAVALVGAVPVPLNSYGLRDELLDSLREVEPGWLFCDADRHRHVVDDLPGLGCRAVVVDGPPAPGVPAWGEWLAPGGPVCTTPELGPEAPCLILFTSGASSRAKGVLSTQRAVCQGLFNIDYIGALSALLSPDAVAKLMAKALPPTTLTAVPLFHVSGLHAQLLTALRHGRRLVFMHRWDPARALQLIEAERITQFNGAPSMVMQLMAQPGFDDPARTGSLSGVGFGGAGLPQRLIDEVQARFSDSLSGIGFGMTETNGAGAAASGRLFQALPRAAGVLSPIVAVQVVDEDGAVLPPGTAGEICLRGVSRMQAYWRQPEATAEALRGGWLHTGDVGYVDADGFLHVVDRLKDVINRAGEKIAAAEIESCLLHNPDLAEAAVFGLPDATTGEAVVAVVVPRPGVHTTEQVLRTQLAGRLAAYKVPTRIQVRDEALPRNPAGKVLKQALKAAFKPGPEQR